MVSANASALRNEKSDPDSRAIASVAMVRYHPAVALRRPAYRSKLMPTPSMPYRTSPAIVIARP